MKIADLYLGRKTDQKIGNIKSPHKSDSFPVDYPQ